MKARETRPAPISTGNAPVAARNEAAPGEYALTPPQKAALIIAALGPEAAGPIIDRIGESHLRAFTRAYAHLQTVPRAALLKVIAEFIAGISTTDNNIKGGFDEARALLGHFKSADDIIRLMDDISVPGGESVWKKLERVSDDTLGDYLSGQRPQVVAVVLAKLNTEKASQILDQLDAKLAGDVVLRLSKPMNVDDKSMKIVADAIERDLLTPMRMKAKAHNPGEMIGAMLNNVMSDKREQLLGILNANTPEILKDVRKSMLTFEDIATRVPGNAVSMAIKEVELQDFLRAVKFGKQNAPSSVEYIFANISQRMVKQYEEQMEEMGSVSVKEGEAAQAKFMTVVRSLAKAGEFALIEIKDEAEEDEAAA